MAEQPTGTVTLLFSDIEGSTALLQRLGAERYAQALELHRRLLREAFERHGGYEVDYEGDAFFIAFESAADAVSAASEVQQALAGAEWPQEREIKVRLGLHTGEPVAVPPKYVGLDVHKAARVMAAGHGGQVLLTRTTRELLGTDVAVRELGAHQLKDLLQAEPLYQLLVPGLRDEFPALKTLGNRSTNLPVVATPFIGREKELGAVQELLLRDDVRLLTLTGVGGIGKTRLALQAAADVIDGFRDGVYWVPFAPLRDGALVAATVAKTLGLREEPGEAISDIVLRYLRDRQLLLLLDNLEHLLAEACELAAAILSAASDVRILTTSREPLRVRGEQLYDVPALAVPGATDEALERLDAVQLFVGRAQAADSSFVFTDASAAAVGEIVRRLDGLPLAIELAAARTRALPPAALLTRLDDRLRLLTGGARDADSRQQTLVATIRWSYDLLTAEEQRLFAMLSVFVGGFRMHAAATVCGVTGPDEADLLDLVMSLVDKSLLRVRIDPDGEPRYWMLETIRDFAARELTEDATQRAFVAWAQTSADEAEADGSFEAVANLGRERQNLIAALRWCLDSSNFELAGQLLVPLGLFWYLTGSAGEGARYFDVVLPYVRSTAVRGRLLHWAAVYRAGRDDEGALAMLEESLRLVEDAGDVRGIAYAYFALTDIGGRFGGIEASLAYAEAAVAHARSAADDGLLAPALGNLGQAHLLSGNLEKATAALKEARGVARRVGDTATEAQVLLTLADGAASGGHFEEALRLTEEAVGLTRPGEASLHRAYALAMLAAVRLLTGELPEARRALELAGAQAASIYGYDFLATIGAIAAALATATERPEALQLWQAVQTLRSSEAGYVTRLVTERFAPNTAHEPLDFATAADRLLDALTEPSGEDGDVAAA